MKKIKRLFIVLIFFILLIGESMAHVQLDYPAGGETFNTGDMVTIRWEIVIYHGTCDWDLYFTTNNGVDWIPIVSNIPESELSYIWTVPNVSSSLCRVKVVQDNQEIDYDSYCNKFTIVGPTGINDKQISLNDFVLYPAYPNPFNPTTHIEYSVSEQSLVSLKVYDLLGNEVAALVNETKQSGKYNIELDATGWTSGIYFYKLQAVELNSDSRKTFVQTKKIILLK